MIGLKQGQGEGQASQVTNALVTNALGNAARCRYPARGNLDTAADALNRIPACAT